MAGGAIIHRWHAATGVRSSSFQMEKTAVEKVILWLEESEDWRKALLICDCKSLVDTTGNSHAPDGCIRLLQAAVARLNAERCLEVLWVPGHCGLICNENADDEAKLGSAEHHPSVALGSATRRIAIRRAGSSTADSISLHATICIRIPLLQDVQVTYD